MKRNLNYIQKIILFEFIFVFFACLGCFLMYNNFGKKANKLINENKDLQAQYDTLLVYIENRANYLEETQANNKEILDIADTYPAQVTKKSTLYKYDRLLEDYNLKSSSLTLNSPEDITTVYATEENIDYTLVCSQVPVDISYSIKYSDLKKFISDIRELGSKVNINSIAISQDLSTGEITGVLNTVEYQINGGRKEYSDPSINMNTGIDSIFGDDPVIQEGGAANEVIGE